MYLFFMSLTLQLRDSDESAQRRKKIKRWIGMEILCCIH
jgi:hypothetical protein